MASASGSPPGIRRMLTGLLLLFTAAVLADVEFTSPAPGELFVAGAPMEIKWRESGVEPLLKRMDNYQLTLCAGGNAPGSFIELSTIVANGSFKTTRSAKTTIPPTIGGPTKNGYFLKMVATVPGRGSITSYSPRFGSTTMAGSFPPDIETAIKVLPAGMISGPDKLSDLADAGGANPGNRINPRPTTTHATNLIGTAVFKQPFAKQTGPTRYAPMQMVPPTKITKKKHTPMHPTSKVSKMATTRLRPATDVEMTVTQSRTYSFPLQENQIDAWPGPKASKEERKRFKEKWDL